MQLLSAAFLSAFPLRVINVHPALLPAFPGVRAVEQALDYGVKVFGVTPESSITPSAANAATNRPRSPSFVAANASSTGAGSLDHPVSSPRGALVGRALPQPFHALPAASVNLFPHRSPTRPTARPAVSHLRATMLACQWTSPRSTSKPQTRRARVGLLRRPGEGARRPCRGFACTGYIRPPFPLHNDFLGMEHPHPRHHARDGGGCPRLGRPPPRHCGEFAGTPTCWSPTTQDSTWP